MNELNELNILLNEATVTTIPDLLDKLSPDTIQAIRADLIAAQPLTGEEQAFFAAEHNLSVALRQAATAAQRALNGQEATALADAVFHFEVAHAAARKLEQATWVRDTAFKLTAEYRAQQAAKGGAQ